jgi:hypothetical protein
MQHSTEKPTKEEQAWIERVRSYGCICCIESGYRNGRERIEYHHIVDGRRLGHFFGLPLCVGHHQARWSPRQLRLLPEPRRVAICEGRAAFAAAFGPERELWRILRDHVGLAVEWPESKILPRRLG